MPMLKFPIKPRNPLVWNVIVPACSLIGIVAVDHYFFKGVILSPTCNFAAMALVALYMTPRVMAIWACLFVVSSFVVLAHPNFVTQGPYDMHHTDLIRCAGAAVGGVVTLVLCVSRNRISKSNEHLLLLLKRMPVPFVLSDENGTVFFVNEQAAELLKVSTEDALGDSHFSLLEDLSNKGMAIQKYLSLFESPEFREVVTAFRPRNNTNVTLVGTLIPLQIGRERWMVTTISEDGLKLKAGQSVTPGPLG